MNYEDMSDFEINKLVAEKLGHKLVSGCFTRTDGAQWVRTENHRGFDPCNKPEHSWPIIIENRININFYDDNEGVQIETSTGKRWENCVEDNPLRSSMITFLKIGERK